jgi:hypothetical protein
VWKSPVFHETAYAFMVLVLIIQSVVLIRRLKVSSRVYATSVVYYALGFLFWNLDNNFCETLKSIRGKN